ncbi:MAG TPA: PQQ-dependent sugar dehydrogenase [Phycisphaerales bacterium]|nr:PQQ-dependent sugar dehydrogenase [Phycisphaerales bacterium]
MEVVAEGLEVPWDIVFLPDGRMLVTERPGRVRVIDAKGVLRAEPLHTVPNVKTARGEIGLMGMCLHPAFANNGYVYLAYGHTDGDVRVDRYTLAIRPVSDGSRPPLETLAGATPILKGIPASVNHAGCRVGFGPDGKLYITAGEMFKKELAQDLTSLGGKTLRVNDDGSIPEDNPFAGPEHRAKGVRPEIWSYGHRNAQGMDWQPGSGRMFQSEHGPSGEAGHGGDEVNLVEKGKNYGWPIIHHDETREGMEAPLVTWTPATAPASGAFYTGDLFPEWKGNFMVGMLGGLGREKRPGVYRIVLDGPRYVGHEVILTDHGRIREVAQGPDGALYVTTSNRDGRARPSPGDDKVLRLVPASR